MATKRKRQFGRTYPAARLEVDLAQALEAAGQRDAPKEVRARAGSLLEPLDCVNPF